MNEKIEAKEEKKFYRMYELLDETELIPTPIWAFYTKPIKVSFSDKEITVTELIDSPLKRKLLRQYYEQVERKMTSIHSSILGTVVHLLFELKEFDDFLFRLGSAVANEDKDKVFEVAKQFLEARKRKTVAVEFGGYKVVGTYDLFEDGILYDFKIVSEFAIREERLEKFSLQLQLYRYLIEQATGEKVEKLKNVCILKDFSLFKSKFRSPVVVIEYDIWDDKKVVEYIRERLKVHSDERYCYCSAEDIWFRTKYLVGDKEFYKKEFAEEYARKKGFSFSQIKIIGEPLRCMYFCEVADFCDQYKAFKQLNQ